MSDQSSEPNLELTNDVWKLGLRSASDWAELVKAIGSVDVARRWLEVIGRGPRRLELIRELAEGDVPVDEFSLWLSIGISPKDVASYKRTLASAGLGVTDVRRWLDQRLGLSSLEPLLPEMNERFEFDALLDLLDNWQGKPVADPLVWPGQELRRILDGGFTMQQVRDLMDRGLTGHQILQWQPTEIPPTDWLLWIKDGISPDAAQRYFEKGVNRGRARDLIDATKALDEEDEEVEFEPYPWEVDPTEQLPDVIEPGYVSFILWSMAAGGDYVGYELSFEWKGERSATWYQDISMVAGDRSPASSSPIRGTVDWSNGKDVDLTFEWSEMSMDGGGSISGAAPTVDDPKSDAGARIPRNWIRLGDSILNWIYSSL
nr:hypothetical protein [Mycolicibacterium sp. P1-18]